MNLSDYIENNIAIDGVGGKRKYYPSKPRNCKNCHFVKFDTNLMKYYGCGNGFDTHFNDKNQQAPSEKCYPVKDDSYLSEAHADKVSIKITELRQSDDDDDWEGWDEYFSDLSANLKYTMDARDLLSRELRDKLDELDDMEDGEEKEKLRNQYVDEHNKKLDIMEANAPEIRNAEKHRITPTEFHRRMKELDL